MLLSRRLSLLCGPVLSRETSQLLVPTAIANPLDKGPASGRMQEPKSRSIPVSERLAPLEVRVIRTGLSILSILGFGAYFVHELWRILEPFLHN